MLRVSRRAHPSDHRLVSAFERTVQFVLSKFGGWVGGGGGSLLEGVCMKLQQQQGRGPGEGL